MSYLSRLSQAAGLVLALALGAGHAVASGIPVVDVAGLAQAVQQYTTLTEQLAALKEQYDTAVKQLESLKEQANTLKGMYDDLSGISGHAQMLQGAVSQLHSFIPAELTNPAGMLKGKIAGIAAQLRAETEKFTGAALFPNNNQSGEREQYEADADYAFAYKAQAKAAYDAFADRRAALESLATAGTTATTPGSKLDLIAKAVAENSLLLNDIAQMIALQISAQADRAIIDHNRQGAVATQAVTK